MRLFKSLLLCSRVICHDLFSSQMFVLKDKLLCDIAQVFMGGLTVHILPNKKVRVYKHVKYFQHCVSQSLLLTVMILVQETAVLKDVRALQIIPGELVKPFKSSFPSRLALSRAELVEKLLQDLGTHNSGFTLENVLVVNELHSTTSIFTYFFLCDVFKETLFKIPNKAMSVFTVCLY